MYKLNKKGWLIIGAIIIIAGIFSIYSYNRFQQEQEFISLNINAEKSSDEYLQNLFDLYHSINGKYPRRVNELKEMVFRMKDGNLEAYNANEQFLKNKDLIYYVRESDYQAYKLTYISIDGSIKTIQNDYANDLQKQDY